jgi:carbonic anhydrase
MITAREALQRLVEGNLRYVAGETQRDAATERARRTELVENQQPIAIVLGCSDSRVPLEIIFDQGVGDLFVIRVAGNIVAPSQIGSVEFAAERFGVRLVVVMGHSCCGAVAAALEAIRQQTPSQSPHLGFIVDKIKPRLEKLLGENPDLHPDLLLEKAVSENVRASLAALRHGSETLETLIRDQGLMVLGAEYSLQTGAVEFYDEPS